MSYTVRSLSDGDFEFVFQLNYPKLGRFIAQRLPIFLLFFLLAAVQAEAAARADYTEVFYPSGTLGIQAYLYRPYGNGPFPVVIFYNHGARRGRERLSVPLPHIGRLLTRAGYIALVCERRGYGRSDGLVLSDEVADDRAKLIPRLQEETDDVLAALDYLRTLAFADIKRVGIMGWSHGGIITLLAVSRSTEFAVAINQAGGALTWNGNPHVREALITAAEKVTTPMLLQVAKNDRTTSSIATVAEVLKKRGVPHRGVIYEPFKPTKGDPATPPGHRIFSAEGMHLWEKDVLEFLSRYLNAKSTDAIGR